MRHALLVLALLPAACGQVVTSTDAGDESAADAAPADADPRPPMIDQALAAECGGYTPPSGVGPGDDLHRVTLDAPGAVCNDGTPAVMYVRPSTGGIHSDRWVVYLQGGGGCSSLEECSIRYCGTEKYTKAKMSSRWAPPVANTDGQGLLDRDGVNPFGEANQVLLYYCSSDSWLGQHDDAVLTSDDDPAVAVRLHYRGHTIVEAALDALIAGAVSDDAAVTMPSLADASALLWSGTSAGGTGAEQHLDHVAARLPDTAVRGYFDAQLAPRNADSGDAGALLDTFDRDHRWPVILQETHGAFVDASCLAMHPPDEQWQCGQQAHVVMNHITTPFFVRQDLRDTAVGRRHLEAGLSIDELAHAYRATLAELPRVPDDGEEGHLVEVTPGTYVPNCGQHVAATNGEFFAEATVENSSGIDLTVRAALAQWLTGAPTLAIDTHPATTSVCPEAVDSPE